MKNKFIKRSKYQTEGVVDKGPWGGYNSRFEMMAAQKAQKEKDTELSDNRDHMNRPGNGNFRYSTTSPLDYSQNIRVGSNTANSEMMSKYSQTLTTEDSQYGEDKHGMTTKERAAYNKKYHSTVGPTAGKSEWTFNEGYSAARKEGKKEFQMLENGKWVSYSTRRADETVDQFNKSFVVNSPEQIARNEERTGRLRIGYGPGDPLNNIDGENIGFKHIEKVQKRKGGFLEPPTEYI